MNNDNKNIILAIESSGATCGTAIAECGNVICSYSVFGRNIHDKILASLIQRALNDTETAMENISVVAVSAGPGSFTGLRIGASIAKGLCFESKPRLIAVATMKAMADEVIRLGFGRQFDMFNIILPFYKSQYYSQLFDNLANTSCEVQSVDEINIIENNPNENDVLAVSNDEAVLSNFANKSLLLKLLPDYIARTGFAMSQRNEYIESKDFTPHYVREFEPKIKFNPAAKY
jgi:tRNA threonylcarbamoyladenosine biosynthesis protein TsaB